MNLITAKSLAITKMKEHGLYKKGWKFQYDNAKLRFGQCDCYNKIIRLSKYLVELNDKGEVLDTILHEIAHALTPKDADSHGSEWKRMCKKIGANPERYCPESVKIPQARYTAKCTCGKKFDSYRMPPLLSICTCQDNRKVITPLRWKDNHSNEFLTPPRRVFKNKPFMI